MLRLATFLLAGSTLALQSVPTSYRLPACRHLGCHNLPPIGDARTIVVRDARRAVVSATAAEADGALANSGLSDSCPVEEARTRDLFRFIVPTLAGWLSSEVMTLVDTAVVGSCSAAELAALGPATMLIDSAAYLFFWLNVATTSLFATAIAAGKGDAAFDTLSDGLYVALACGVCVTLFVGTFGPALLTKICSSAIEVVPASAQYLRIRLFGLPAFMCGMVLQAACLGAKDSLSPLLVLVASGLLNLGLDLFLVRTCGMGIGGAAVATLAAQLLQTTLLAIVVQRKRRARGLGGSWLLLRGRPSLRRLRTFLTFAGPMALVLFGKIACYNSMTLAATTDVASLAAHQVLISIFFVGCKFGDAVSQTSQAYLPACLPLPPQAEPGTSGGGIDVREGVSRPAPIPAPIPAPARRLSGRLLRLSIVLGAFVSTAAFLIATRLPTIFTSEASVIGLVLKCAPLLFIALCLHPPTMTAEGLLIGSLEVNFLAKAYAVKVLVFLGALRMVATRQLGLTAVWAALATFQLVRLATFSLRLRRTRLAFRRLSLDG